MSLLTLLPKKKKTRRVQTSLPTPPAYAPTLVPAQHPVPARLSKKLTNLRRKFRFVHTGQRAAQCLGAAVMLITLQMFLDWLVDLNFLERVVILAGDIGLLVFFLRKKLLPLVLLPPNLEACALMVEKHWPRLRGRVIATIQLARPHFTTDSPELVYALQQETEARTVGLDFGKIVATRPLRRYASGALILTALWILLMITFRPGSVALLERVFLLPAKVPRKTEVVCLSGNKIIPEGDSVVLEAQALGIIPSHGLVTLVDDAGKIQEITLDPEPDHRDRFSLKIDSVDQPLTYTIRLNDGTSDAYRVKVIPRPNVTSIDCEQVYPAYTGLGTVKRTVENLALLAGSRLQIHAIANGKIVKASLKLVGTGQELPLKIGGPEDTDLTGEIDIPASGLTGFSIQLTNEAGVTSGDETQYRIDLIPDHPPTIQLTYPERLEELYTLKAKPTIAFVASDDYGLAKIALLYRIVQDQDSANGDATGTPPPPPEPKRIDMELGTDHPLNMKNHYEWDLAAVRPPLTEGTTIEYWMEAQDANNVTGPGISESEHHTIKIVSEMEKKAEIMNRLMDSLSTITDISQNQEKINQDLGAAIQGKQEKK
ncbi:MAG: DUF4175 domain-containing protein [Methylacidiphilales bacterium]|nr:DUF4175 domain-containing protein [Candidatus Methylacidiphilales bacterium]